MTSSSAIGQFVIGQSPIQGVPFSPVAQQSVQKTILAYLYTQYQNDDSLAAFISSYNSLSQEYLDWFNQTNLPIYTSPTITGPLLDWVASGLYGYPRPVLSTGSSRTIGPFNTYAFNSLPFNASKKISSGSIIATTDDIYKRCLTWNYYKGDGGYFTLEWLKRRILRFLLGENGVDPGIEQTYDISVVQTSEIAIQITIGTPGLYFPGAVSALQEGIYSGALQTPFQFTFAVDFGGSGFGYSAFGSSSF